ncbi:MAG: uroporphyrinogen-III synthase [Pseudomonadota bacterium]
MPALLITRPQPLADVTAMRLQERGVETIVYPMLWIAPRSVTWPDFATCDATALTSVNGLHSLHTQNNLPQNLLGKPCFCVGDATTKMAQEYGFAQCFNARGNAKDLGKLLHNTLPAQARVWHISAEITAGKLAIFAPDLQILPIASYSAHQVEKLSRSVKAAIETGKITAVGFWSARTMQAFCGCIAANDSKKMTAICFSSTIAQALPADDWRAVVIAKRADEDAMFVAIESGIC